MKTNKMTQRKLQSHGRSWVLIFSALLFLLFAGSPALAQDLYKVTMTQTGNEGLTTDCSSEGYILATGDTTGLTGSGSEQDTDGEFVPLALNIVIGDPAVEYDRDYDPGDGTHVVFNGCLGGPSGPTGYSGALFISFGGGKGPKGGSTVSFTWHFEYYIADGVREHFTLKGDKIPFPAWTGTDVSGTVKGNFTLLHYLNDGTRKVRNYYVPIDGGENRLFEFVLTIEKVQ